MKEKKVRGKKNINNINNKLKYKKSEKEKKQTKLGKKKNQEKIPGHRVHVTVLFSNLKNKQAKHVYKTFYTIFLL
jgi:hypothetical protein